MTEIFARLAAGPRVAARQELQFQPAPMEQRLPDVVRQERRAARELREEWRLAWRRGLLDATARRVSGQQPTAPQAHRPEHREGAAEERRRDARRQERQPAEQPQFRQQAWQPVSELE